MKRMNLLTKCAVALAFAGLLVPPQVRAAVAAPAVRQAAPTIQDVELQAGGTFLGQVLDQAGVPKAGADVQIRQNGQVVATTRTDADGHFAASGLRGGLYQVVTSDGGGIYRAWAHRTAPPSAQRGALLLESDPTVRGAHNGGLLAFLTNPWVLGGLVLTAILVPVLLDDDDDAS